MWRNQSIHRQAPALMAVPLACARKLHVRCTCSFPLGINGSENISGAEQIGRGSTARKGRCLTTPGNPNNAPLTRWTSPSFAASWTEGRACYSWVRAAFMIRQQYNWRGGRCHSSLSCCQKGVDLLPSSKCPSHEKRYAWGSNHRLTILGVLRSLSRLGGNPEDCKSIIDIKPTSFLT